MNFKKDVFYGYLKEAPLPLALERIFESDIYSQKEFPRPILDIGCGEGLFAYAVFDEKIDLGIDPNIRELQRAKEYGMYHELIQCCGDRIPRKPGSFNTIFSNSVLEHIPDVDAVLREARRLLSEKGKMFITVPTDKFDHYSIPFQLLSFVGLKGLAERYRIFFNKFWRHYHYYSAEEWTRIFNKNGLKVTDCHEYNSKFVCMINDFLSPVSFFSFVNKKFTNRWIVFPGLRKFTAKLLDKMFYPVFTKDKQKNKNCGLVFFELQRADYDATGFFDLPRT